MSNFAVRFFENRVTGRAAIANTIIRVLTGAIFVFTGYLKLADPSTTATGLTQALGLPDLAILAVLLGMVEFLGGLMLIAGLGTRLAALGLFITMIGANIANLKLMPSVLPVTIVLLILMGYLLWAGPGPYAVDNKLATRFHNRTA